MEFALHSIVNSWIEKHPLVVWLLQHPITSLIGFSLAIVLLLRLFSAVAYLLDKFWLWLLKLPILLFKLLLRKKNQPPQKSSAIVNSQLEIESEKITCIIEQLEKINQQQQQIIQDIALLKQQDSLRS